MDAGSGARLDDARLVVPFSGGIEEHVRHLERIFRLAPVGIGVIDNAGRVILGNDSLRQLLGYDEQEFAQMPWWEYTHPDDIKPNVDLVDRMTGGEIDHFSMEKRFIRKDGALIWAELTSSMVFADDGTPEYSIGLITDITERKRLEAELSNAEQHYRLLVERVPAVVYISDVGPDAQWHYVSPQITEMLGFTPEEWLADPDIWYRQLHPDDREAAVAGELEVASLGDGATHSGNYRMVRRDGTVLWIRDDAIVLHGADGTSTWHGVLVDVTREKDLEARLGHQAYHDPLTGLPNRVLFQQRVDEALARSGAGDVTVLLVDLDHFKNVNDSFGHAYGDEVIVAAARRISSCVRSRGIAVRLGGDEFAVLLEHGRPDQAVAIADDVLAALRDAPVRLRDVTVTVAGSVGIATAAPGDSTDTLLRNADLAMYRAKRQGRGRHFSYHVGLHDEVVSRFRIEEALSRAVRGDGIDVAYQPIVDVRHGEVVGLEALARWHDPVLGPVSPAEFIPIAEQSGLIRDLGLCVVREACSGLAGWRRSTGGTAYVSVNVSPLQLDEDFAETVAGILRETGLDPGALVLEVTEGLLLVEGSRATVQQLRATGVKVAIDDFGTGYSSLSYLRQLPVDLIKIDQVFLRSDSGDERGSNTLLEAVVALTRSLQIPAICEGVETAEQLASLMAIGCDYAQGYLLARPGPLEDVPPRYVISIQRPST